MVASNGFGLGRVLSTERLTRGGWVRVERDDELVGFGDFEGGADEALDVDRVVGQAVLLLRQLLVEGFQTALLARQAVLPPG